MMISNVVRVFVASSMLLSAATAFAQTPADPQAPAAPVSPEEKVRCKRYTEIGSLARVHKECHTAREWQQMAEAARAGARDMMDRQSTSGTGPQ